MSGCCCLVGDHLGHRPVITEYLRLAKRYVSGGNRLLDLLPGAMSGKTNHGIPNAGAGSAGLAGGVRSARRGSAPPMPRQGATCRGRVRRRSARPSHPPPWRAPSGASAGRSPRRGRSVGSEPIRTMPQSGSRRQVLRSPASMKRRSAVPKTTVTGASRTLWGWPYGKGKTTAPLDTATSTAVAYRRHPVLPSGHFRRTRKPPSIPVRALRTHRWISVGPVFHRV